MKKNIIFLLILTMMVGAFPANIYAMGMDEGPVVQEQQAISFAVGDALVKKYRTHQGKYQYRWWNKTRSSWAVGSKWINA